VDFFWHFFGFVFCFLGFFVGFFVGFSSMSSEKCTPTASASKAEMNVRREEHSNNIRAGQLTSFVVFVNSDAKLSNGGLPVSPESEVLM
jgi:hypothetical protein